MSCRTKVRHTTDTVGNDYLRNVFRSRQCSEASCYWRVRYGGMHGRGARRPQSRCCSQQRCAACTQIVQYDDSVPGRITYDRTAGHYSTFAALLHE
jgi:hypothetical protein